MDQSTLVPPCGVKSTPSCRGQLTNWMTACSTGFRTPSESTIYSASTTTTMRSSCVWGAITRDGVAIRAALGRRYGAGRRWCYRTSHHRRSITLGQRATSSTTLPQTWSFSRCACTAPTSAGGNVDSTVTRTLPKSLSWPILPSCAGLSRAVKFLPRFVLPFFLLRGQRQGRKQLSSAIHYRPGTLLRLATDWVGPLPDLWLVGLGPAEEGGMRNVHTAVGQHELEFAIAHREHEVSADRPDDHLGGELPTLEGLVRDQ